MKIRNGFVSNSSSSSFVVALPPDFDPNLLPYKKAARGRIADEENEDQSEEEVIEGLKKGVTLFLKRKECWALEDEDFGGLLSVASTLFEKYIVAEIETGSDGADQLVLANSKRLAKIFGIGVAK